MAIQKKTQKNRWVRRNYRREALIDKFYDRREALKKELVAAAGDIEKQFDIIAQRQQ